MITVMGLLQNALEKRKGRNSNQYERAVVVVEDIHEMFASKSLISCAKVLMWSLEVVHSRPHFHCIYC